MEQSKLHVRAQLVVRRRTPRGQLRPPPSFRSPHASSPRTRRTFTLLGPCRPQSRRRSLPAARRSCLQLRVSACSAADSVSTHSQPQSASVAGLTDLDAARRRIEDLNARLRAAAASKRLLESQLQARSSLAALLIESLYCILLKPLARAGPAGPGRPDGCGPAEPARQPRCAAASRQWHGRGSRQLAGEGACSLFAKLRPAAQHCGLLSPVASARPEHRIASVSLVKCQPVCGAGCTGSIA